MSASRDIFRIGYRDQETGRIFARPGPGTNTDGIISRELWESYVGVTNALMALEAEIERQITQ